MPREFADPYVYRGTDVLKSKPGLRDSEALRRFEYEQTASRAAELQARPIPGKFDLQHLRAVHKQLFQDVYPWAGEVRTVNIFKGGQRFAGTALIESYTASLSANLAKENHLRGLDKPQFVERLAHHYNEFKIVHPLGGESLSTTEAEWRSSLQRSLRLEGGRRRPREIQWSSREHPGSKGFPIRGIVRSTSSSISLDNRSTK